MVVTTWYLRGNAGKHDFIDKVYEQKPSFFTLAIHHGGVFSQLPNRRYIEGRVSYFDCVDGYQFSLLELNVMLQELGYNVKTQMLYHFKAPDRVLDDGLYPLSSDEDVRSLVKYVDRFKLLEVYVEKGKKVRIQTPLKTYSPRKKMVRVQTPCKKSLFPVERENWDGSRQVNELGTNVESINDEFFNDAFFNDSIPNQTECGQGSGTGVHAAEVEEHGHGSIILHGQGSGTGVHAAEVEEHGQGSIILHGQGFGTGVHAVVGPLTPNAAAMFELIKKEAERYRIIWNGGTKFQVAGPWQDQHVVDMIERTCTCRKWELSGMPCKHVVATFNDMGNNGMQCAIPESYVDPVYWLATWRTMYSFTIGPTKGRAHWPKFDSPITILPPKHKVSIGRPKKKRRRSQVEIQLGKEGKLTRAAAYTKCRNCKQDGHNKRTCTRGPSQQAAGSSSKAAGSSHGRKKTAVKKPATKNKPAGSKAAGSSKTAN